MRKEQQKALQARSSGADLPDCVLDAESGLMRAPDVTVWIPDEAADLQARLCVVAHASAAGHRGAATSARALKSSLSWHTLESNVAAFVARCLYCMVAGGERVPRPFGPADHGTKPNEVLHFDFLALPASSSGSRSMFVVKDDMSGYVGLVECVAATASEAAAALIDWAKRFG